MERNFVTLNVEGQSKAFNRLRSKSEDRRHLKKQRSEDDVEYLHNLKKSFISKVTTQRQAFRVAPHGLVLRSQHEDNLDKASTAKNASLGLRKALKVTSKGRNDLRVGVELKDKPKFSAMTTKPPTTASLRRGKKRPPLFQ